MDSAVRDAARFRVHAMLARCESPAVLVVGAAARGGVRRQVEVLAREDLARRFDVPDPAFARVARLVRAAAPQRVPLVTVEALPGDGAVAAVESFGPEDFVGGAS